MRYSPIDGASKSLRLSELVSRVRAHLRRRHMNAKRRAQKQWKLEFPSLKIDLLRRQVVCGGKLAKLTAMQFEVLVLLASQPGRVYSQEQIMGHLYDGKFFGDARAAVTHIQDIRKKIESDPGNPRYIHTVRGFGYMFAELPYRDRFSLTSVMAYLLSFMWNGLINIIITAT